jgi:DNA-binding CsgD family transcriptional regulator
VRDLYKLRSYDDFTSYLVRALPSITEGDFTSFNEIHPNSGRSSFKTDLAYFFQRSAHYGEVLSRYANTHPILNHMRTTRSGKAVTMTDLIPMSQFRETILYNEFYNPLRIPYIIGIALEIDKHRTITLARHRQRREFGDKCKALLNAARPHIQQAFRNSLALRDIQNKLSALNEALETSRQGILAVREDGRIRWGTANAYEILSLHRLGNKTHSNQLPAGISAWLNHHRRELKSPREVAQPISPLIIKSGRGSLSIRILGDESETLLLLESQQRYGTERLVRSLGLSKRETEIMHWVVEGKTNPEIGIILGISPRTVQKHLERAYKHLGVENRHAAISMVLT